MKESLFSKYCLRMIFLLALRAQVVFIFKLPIAWLSWHPIILSGWPATGLPWLLILPPVISCFVGHQQASLSCLAGLISEWHQWSSI